jgi:DNA modification methylase
MLTLNGEQTQHGLINHICPLQFDIVDRIIRRYTNEGEIVFDPFAGIMTVPYRAIKLGRYGRGVELNAEYFKDGLRYLKAAEREAGVPSLFDALKEEVTA